MALLQVILIGIAAVVLAAFVGLVVAYLKFAIPRSVAQPGAPRIVKSRTRQTTAVLPTGRVLVVGGHGPQRSAELYDPTEGAWTPAASLATARYGHTATLLADGRVLIAGGSDCRSNCTFRNALRSVEIYDPASDAWTPAQSMNSSRWGHIAVLRPDGRVLVSGGIGLDPGNEPSGQTFPKLASSEVYDPERGTWTAAAPMHVARDGHLTAQLPDGRLFVAGGGDRLDWSEPRWPRQTAEVYDPTSDTWRLTAPVPYQVFEWLAALPDGTVLALLWSLRKWSIYDPATDRWGAVQSEEPPISDAEPIVLPSGLVLVSGGTSREALTAVADAALFDPHTGIWTPTGSMGIARGYGGRCQPSVTVYCESHMPVLLQDGTVLVYGGRQAKNRDKFSNPPYVVTSEVYDPASGTWSPRGR